MRIQRSLKKLGALIFLSALSSKMAPEEYRRSSCSSACVVASVVEWAAVSVCVRVCRCTWLP